MEMIDLSSDTNMTQDKIMVCVDRRKKLGFWERVRIYISRPSELMIIHTGIARSKNLEEQNICFQFNLNSCSN